MAEGVGSSLLTAGGAEDSVEATSQEGASTLPSSREALLVDVGLEGDHHTEDMDTDRTVCRLVLGKTLFCNLRLKTVLFCYILVRYIILIKQNMKQEFLLQLCISFHA